MKKDLKFTGYFMTINKKALNIDEFKGVLPEQEHKYTYAEQYYTFTPLYVDHYLFLPISHGSPYPLPDNVRNIKTFETEKNPRSEEQYEERQDYAIIDFNTGYLWISNIYRKIVLWTIFQEKFINQPVSIKEVYDEKEFIDKIDRLDEIKFSAVPNLFSSTSTLSEELNKELLGYGGATTTIHFKYENTKVIDFIRAKLSSLLKSKAAFKSIMISGKDESGIGMFFNPETIMKKITIKTTLNDNGTFNDEDVLTNLKNTLN